jgi:perosamine synthetase
VIRSGWIGLGPETEKLERNIEKFIGKEHIVSTNSATAALHLALIIAGVTEGDEVISPALTFVSTNHVILYQKATPVFCDVDPVTLCADPKDIAKKITKKTKAIMVVHYGGHAVDMDPIMKLAKEKGLVVIEDAAHAFGGFYKNKPLGTIGDIGCYSFHAIKGVAMGDGGAVFTKKKRDAERLKKLRWMGISKDTWKRTDKSAYSWYYDVEEVGYKYHPNDLVSSIGNEQLKKYPKALKRKRQIYEFYTAGLANIPWLEIPLEQPYTVSALHNYCVKTKHRDAFHDYLADKGIATTMHYIPNNHYKMYKSFKADIPVTEKVWKQILLLPFHPELTDKDIAYIVETIKKFKP